MLRKIPVKKLQPGMYVTNNQAHSLDYPLLYCGEGMLESIATIEGIHDSGYTEALIDLDRSDKHWQLVYGGSDEEILTKLLSDAPHLAALKPTVGLEEELPRAEHLYSRALDTARRVMADFRGSGTVDIASGSLAVKGIVESVTRNSNALLALSKLRRKDDYTFSHCINVATVAVLFTRSLGYDETVLRTVGLAGFFHDLGKMGVPLEILNSPRRLTPEEFAVMREHPRIGHEHLKNIPDLSELVVRGALEHHERVNGTGYPFGRKGDEISLTGKILAVVDVYDALSSRRVYKEAMSPHTTLGLLYGMRGEDFMPELVDRFIQCIGIYPAGSLVKLSNGYLAVVAQIDPENPLRPQLLPARDATGRVPAPKLLNLKAHASLSITQCLDPTEHNIDPLAILKHHAAQKH